MLVGDSLAEQAAPYLSPLLDPRSLVAQFYPGTAPCDWLGRDLQITADSVVVISFTGNAMSACMTDGTGTALQGQAVVDRYAADVATLISRVQGDGAVVLLVGQPIRADGTPGNDVVAALNGLYVQLAEQPGVTYVDAGAAVEEPDGSFAHALPCLPGEAECDAGGTNVVRSDDGLHFCPGSPPPGACAAYASGAFRFASAIAAAIAGGIDAG